MKKKVFITGGTGYIGSRVIPALIKEGFEVNALVRSKSTSKLPDGCNIIYGDALKGETYEKSVIGCDTFIHLIGVRHPGPGKQDQFKKIDLVSIEQAVPTAKKAGVKHFIYLSVAHPVPVMKSFAEVRIKGEELIRQSGMNATFLRPWYVLGPGHYWPYLLLPMYSMLLALFKLIPATRDTSKRLGFIKIGQMIKCISFSVMNPPEGVRVFEVEEMKEY